MSQNRRSIENALKSFDQNTSEKSGRRSFDDFLDEILFQSRADSDLSDLLSSVAKVALNGPNKWTAALSQILIELENKKHLVVPLIRQWLSKNIEQSDAYRRARLLQVLAQLDAPVPFLELQREHAVKNHAPAVWFDLAVAVTTADSMARHYSTLVDDGKINADLLIARAPSIRTRLGDRAARFFELATAALSDPEVRRDLRIRLNERYAFGLDITDGSEQIQKVVQSPKNISSRFKNAEMNRIIEGLIDIRRSGREAA